MDNKIDSEDFINFKMLNCNTCHVKSTCIDMKGCYMRDKARKSDQVANTTKALREAAAQVVRLQLEIINKDEIIKVQNDHITSLGKTAEKFETYLKIFDKFCDRDDFLESNISELKNKLKEANHVRIK